MTQALDPLVVAALGGIVFVVAPYCALDSTATGACREWLESGSRMAYRSFCPNARLVERLTR